MAHRYPGVQPWHLIATFILAVGFSIGYAGTLVGNQTDEPTIQRDKPVGSLTSEDIEGLRALVEYVQATNPPPRGQEVLDRVDEVLDGIENGDVSVAPETTPTTTAAPATTTSTSTTTTTTTQPPPATTTPHRPSLGDQVNSLVDQLRGGPSAAP